MCLFFRVFVIIALCGAGVARADDSLLSLTDCVTLALARSPGVAAAKAGWQQREAELQAARKALYPSLSFQYDYADQTGSALTDSTYSSAFTVEQPLYKGRALLTNIDLGALAVNDAALARRKARDSLILKVHEAYYGLLSAQRLAGEAEQALLRLKAHLNDAKSFFEAEVIPRNDLLQSEVEEAQGEQDLLAARNQTSLATAKLNLLLRRPVDTPLGLEDCLVYEPRAVAWDTLLQKALANRPELSRQRLASEQAEKRITLARADSLPTVTLSASYEKAGGDFLVASPAYGPTEVKTAQVTARWKFWTWGQGDDKVAAARYLYRQSQEAESEAADAVTLEVRQAYLSLVEAEKNIGVTKKAIVSAEENYRINEERYRVQLNTSTEVLDAQSLLTRARTNYFVALHKYNLALATLDWATGTIDPHDNSTDDAS